MMVAVAAVLCVFCGCSQDDDMYNDSDMYTLAEKMGTRSMGGDPGGVPLKKNVYWRKNSGHNSSPSGILDPINISGPACLPNSTNPILYGEYDTDSLAVSISNYVGDASIYVFEGSIVKDSIITRLPHANPFIFSLAGYTNGEYYHVDVMLNNDTYIGDLDI